MGRHCRPQLKRALGTLPVWRLVTRAQVDDWKRSVHTSPSTRKRNSKHVHTLPGMHKCAPNSQQAKEGIQQQEVQRKDAGQAKATWTDPAEGITRHERENSDVRNWKILKLINHNSG